VIVVRSSFHLVKLTGPLYLPIPAAAPEVQAFNAIRRRILQETKKNIEMGSGHHRGKCQGRNSPALIPVPFVERKSMIPARCMRHMGAELGRRFAN
jgi:hypothetical protein